MGNNLTNLFTETPCQNCKQLVKPQTEEFYRYTTNKKVIEKCKITNNKVQVLEVINKDTNYDFIPDTSNCIICDQCMKSNVKQNNDRVVNYSSIKQSEIKQHVDLDVILDKSSKLIASAREATNNSINNKKTMSQEEYTRTLQTISQISRYIDTYASENNINLRANYKKYYCSNCDSLWTGILDEKANAFTKCDKYICDKCFRNYCCYDGCKNKANRFCKLCKFGFCNRHTGHFNSVKSELQFKEYVDVSCDISLKKVDYWKEITGYIRKPQWNYDRQCYV